MGERRKDFIILGTMLGVVAVIAVGAWFALGSVFDDGKEPIAKTHAGLCQAFARTRIQRTVPGVRGFVLRYPNIRGLRTERTKDGFKRTKRLSMPTQPCPGRCLAALVHGGYDYVENQEIGPGGSGLVGYRYTLKPLGHRDCITVDAQVGFDAEARAAAATLAREGKRCLARIPVMEFAAEYELSRAFRLERLGFSGAVLRLDSQVRRRADGGVIAEQTTYLAFGTEAMLQGGEPVICPAKPGAGLAHLLRPSDVLIAPGRPVREDAERN